MLLVDRFGRPLTKLRISITNRCNYDCIFCHKEGLIEEDSPEASPREIASLVSYFADLGVSDVKITGGEPLIRGDLEEITLGISQIDGIEEVSMTTNASMLEGRAEGLREAGLTRLNVNLPTTDATVYEALTRARLQPAISGALSAERAGIWPIKLNMLLIRGYNDEHFGRVFRFAREHGFMLQVIELEPRGRASHGDFFERHHVDLSRVKRFLDGEAVKKESRGFQKRTVYHFYDGFRVEIVDPLTNMGFCKSCTRMRVTPDLRLKPCFMRDDNLVTVDSTLSNLGQAILRANRWREPYF
ncbi:MAG: GTP 3',8-cyclase MoaA [Candidatus Geothermarchaeales archaeon]